MNRNRLVDRSSSELMRTQFSSSKDPMGIDNATFIWNHARGHLIIMVETSRRVGSGVETIIREDKLILETQLESSYNKPIRSHLLRRENRAEFEEGLIDTRFSEIQLNSGFEYSFISCRVMEANLVKVILGFKPTDKNRNN